MIDKAKLAEWRRRTDAATEGELTVYADGEVYASAARSDGMQESERIAAFDDVDDIRFFVAASVAMPALLDEVERLRTALEQLANEACAGDAICSTMEPDRDVVIANGVDPDVCQCFVSTAKEALR